MKLLLTASLKSLDPGENRILVSGEVAGEGQMEDRVVDEFPVPRRSSPPAPTGLRRSA